MISSLKLGFSDGSPTPSSLIVKTLAFPPSNFPALIASKMLDTATSIRLTAEVKITDFSTSFPSLSLALNTPSEYWSLSTPTIQCLTSPLS